ncbi:MAG: energy transducer TonB [Verrucomicrobia bacterium]|nr:energy transducer TonB [Verrucomicrobiota bacterium]
MTFADPAAGPARWSPARWILIVLLLAAVHVAVVRGFARWPRIPAPGSDRRTSVRLEPSDADRSWFGDPRQFSGQDPAGFSGAAARGFPPPDYGLSEWTGRPRWLGADATSTRLGSLPPPPPPPSAAPLKPPPVQVSGEGPAPRLLPTTTVVSPRGALAERAIHAPGAPSPPQGAEVLAPTVIDVGLHPDGTVVLARVVESSGSPEADQRALAWSRSARFSATGVPVSDSTAISPHQVIWGQLAFLWRVEPAAH